VTLLALWAMPRTVSTAFGRMMIERGDHLVIDEPWSRAYYFGPERRSDRYPLTFPESTYANVRAGVLAAGRSTPVFVKDMAYHAAPGLTSDDLSAMTHTFLIRDPRAALSSLHARWPDWYANAAASTGFAPPTSPAVAAELPERVRALVPVAERELEPLRRHALD